MKATSRYKLGNGMIINAGEEIPADMLKQYPQLKKQEEAKKDGKKRTTESKGSQ